MKLDRQLPCFVLGIETQIGVGVVRELGRAGVRVIGLASQRRSVGLASRYLERGIVVGPKRNEELIQRIWRLGEEYGESVLLAVSETDLLWLAENRELFGKVRIVAPSRQTLKRVLDKDETLGVASSLGIRVPTTYSPKSIEEWRQACGRVRFPAVIKWSDPNQARQLLSPFGLRPEKIEFAPESGTLLQIGQRFAQAGHWPLIQEYCPGQGLGQFFFVHDGTVLRSFQHLRIAEWPPEGGFSSVCDCLPLSQHTKLQEDSARLLQCLGWEGCAMVEYRFDPQTGNAVLMEINGRFWGSFPLAVHARAGFAILAYCVQGLGIVPELPPIREDLRCRMVVTEIKRLVRLFLQRDRIQDPYFDVQPWRELWRFVADFARPTTRYYLWTLDDPGPWLSDMRNYAHQLVGVLRR